MTFFPGLVAGVRGIVAEVIVTCTSCSAQYSVPDAKIRGKKVRITCRHCAAGFVVDASDEPFSEQVRLNALIAAVPPALHGDASEDATRVLPKPNDLSVHDEPTVIGEIPAAALEAERRYAQRTMPAPAQNAAAESPVAGPAAAEPPRALSHDVPEHPLDVTEIASPQAKRASQASLPPPADELAPSLRVPPASLPPQPAAEVKTLLSVSHADRPAHRAGRRTVYWLVALALAALVALFIVRSIR